MPAPAKLNTPIAILEAALVKEKQAYAFYDRMLQSTKIKMMQSLLAGLKDEEAKHVRLIEQKLTVLRMG